MAFQEYPKAMNHPQYRPAVLSKDTIDPVTHQTIKAPPGQPAKFPPVYVNNKDQELDYASKGYVPNGTSDPEAYYTATVGADKPNAHQHVEFPKWLYAKDEQGDLSVVSEAGEHVRVRSLLVKDETQQEKLVGQWWATPGDAANGDEEAAEDPPADDAPAETSVEQQAAAARGGSKKK